MSHNLARDQRRGRRGTVEARRRRRMRPTLMALEDRKLLSTFTVNSTLDDGSVGTLRWAIGQANSTGGAETITFDPTVFATPQTITLTGGQLELSDTSGTETITGPAAGVTVSGGEASRVFQVDPGVTADLSGLTITGGSTSGDRRRPEQRWGLGHADRLHDQRQYLRADMYGGYGGGLNNNGGNVTLTDCTISGNTVGDGSGGGGLANLTNGTTTLTDCTISGNSAIARPGATGGGLIAIRPDALTTLTDCTLSGNSSATCRRRPGRLLPARHGRADQLHRQRQLRRGVGGGCETTSTARPC